MIKKDVREILAEIAPDAIIFESPSFDDSIIGVSSEGGIVYEYEKMVEEFMKDEEVSYEDAAEFIDYNTLRALPYTRADGIAPTVMYSQYFYKY